MLSKNQIKAVQSLKQKKFREEQGLFIAEGTKIVPELLRSAVKVKGLYATSAFLAENDVSAAAEVFEIKEAELERISLLSAPNEVLAVCEMPQYRLEPISLKDKLTLALDDIRDPGNLGTILRIADWFGIEQVICSPDTAELYNPKVVQATMGSIARIQVHYTDLKDFLGTQISGMHLPVYGALLDGKNIYSEKLFPIGIVVIGNESRGISPEVASFVSNRICIPSFSHFRSSEGEAESLNAAIATAIICSEFRRR